VDPRVSLDDVETRNSWPCRASNSDPSVVQPVASRYTNFLKLCMVKNNIYIGNVRLGELSLIKDLLFFCFSKKAQGAQKIDMVHAFKRLSRYEYFNPEI
jgi:hypothetical protein